MKSLILALSFLLLFSLGEKQAKACLCNLVWPEESSITESNYDSVRKWWREEFKGAVFVGRVVKTEKVKVKRFGEIEEMRRIVIKVEHTWAGTDSEEAVVYSWIGDCEGDYSKGRSRFYFAESRDGRLELSNCVPGSLDNKVINSFRRWFGESKSQS